MGAASPFSAAGVDRLLVSVPGAALQVEEQRGKYLDAYDIVLESDETLDVVNGILRYILTET